MLSLHELSFTGGEPFAVRDLVRILDYALDVRPCLVLTNGTDPLLRRFPELRLDTTMAMTRASTPYTGIDPAVVRNEDLVEHADRVLYGSDFPNLPYAYEEERADLWARDLPLPVYRRIFYENARVFFRLTEVAGT